MNMCDIKSMLLVIIICILFIRCNTQYSSSYTFRNVTVRVKVSNKTHPWMKIFVPRADNINDILKTIDRKVKIISFEKQQIPILLRNSINNVRRIKRITITSCGIEKLEPGFVKNVTRIFEFDLSHNNLREIKYGVFNNIVISRLFLNNNKICEIQRKAFTNMTNLEMIILNNNRLTIWDSTWFLKTPVRHVDFSSNMIETLPPGAFEYYKQFRKETYGEFYYINFNDNILTKLYKNSLPEVPILWFLFLEKNFIEEIEQGYFENIEKMEVLKLGHNKLVSFGNGILDQMDVRYLKLNDNYLQSVDVNLTEILNIEGNPLNTECKKQWDERKKRDRDVFERYFYNS
ncbi:hypothetical protein HHI36_001367 [Cryptolaemus montrouzieri]|uniref:Uncharacterized protein n=1 Tax=Cryptolaemus montrouzieri TaxID=559131 RepID=A0ABD2P772_9CUCU